VPSGQAPSLLHDTVQDLGFPALQPPTAAMPMASASAIELDGQEKVTVPAWKTAAGAGCRAQIAIIVVLETMRGRARAWYSRSGRQSTRSR
jgi:hypothetical protein